METIEPITKPVIKKVMKFSASWCVPCKQLAPKFKEIVEKYKKNVKFQEIDINDVEDVTEKYNIHAIPTVLFLDVEDNVINKVIGNKPAEIEKILEENIKINNKVETTKTNEQNQFYKTLEDALTDLGWYHISQLNTDNKTGIDHVNSLFVFNPQTSEPDIKAENKTVIVCDNHDFNETYLIDKVSEELKNRNTKPGDYDLIYIDNICVREYIDNPKFINYRNNTPVEELKLIEKEKLVCKVIVINPEANTITAIEESRIASINENQIKYILNYLDTDFAKKEMSK